MHHHADAHLSAERTVLRRLRLTRFRNFPSLDWRPGAGWNRIEAPNGAGKSSLLEAIYLVSTGKSFRTADLADCRMRAADTAGPEATSENPTTAVVAEIERDGEWELAVTLGDEGRARTLQGKPATLAEQLTHLPLVVWSEADHELVRGPDAARRRFLDRASLLLSPRTVADESALARALKQKRHLLARGPGAAAERELAAWNETLAPLLARRATARRALVAELEAAANARLSSHAAPIPPLVLDYRPSPAEAEEGMAATLGALAGRAAEERVRRQPLLGPQRDRIAIALGEAGTRRFASGGEQKLVGLALAAGLVELLAARGRAPLVLLDDLESELDPARSALAEGLFDGAPQVISTSSRGPREGASYGPRWALETGAINLVKSDI